MKTVNSRDGTSIAYDTVGSGPALVLVGGALSDRSGGTDLADALAPRMTVVTYDRRGRGDSGDGDRYEVAREIDDLFALISTVGGSASVYGHSSGGALALRAVIAGLPIERLVLYEPPFLVDDARPPLPPDFTATLQRLVDEGIKDEALEHFMRIGLLMPEPAIEAVRNSPDWPRMTSLAHTLPYDMAILGEQMAGRPLPDTWRELVTIPTLIFDGDQSPAFLRSPPRQLIQLLPNAEGQTLAGFGHGAPAEVIAPIVEEFLLL